MNGTLTIRPQRYMENGRAPLTYGVFLETNEQFDGIDCWQERSCNLIFVAYSWSFEGAEKAIREIRGLSLSTLNGLERQNIG